MIRGSEMFSTNLLSYSTLIGCIIVIIISTILLIAKGKKLNKRIRTFVHVIIAIAVLIILFLVIMAIGFGSAHPSGPPVPTLKG